MWLRRWQHVRVLVLPYDKNRVQLQLNSIKRTESSRQRCSEARTNTCRLSHSKDGTNSSPGWYLSSIARQVRAIQNLYNVLISYNQHLLIPSYESIRWLYILLPFVNVLMLAQCFHDGWLFKEAQTIQKDWFSGRRAGKAATQFSAVLHAPARVQWRKWWSCFIRDSSGSGWCWSSPRLQLGTPL